MSSPRLCWDIVCLVIIVVVVTLAQEGHATPARSRGGASNALQELQVQLDAVAQSQNAEVQSYAACRISSQELLATAQAAASNVLQQGGSANCNSRELTDTLHNLATQLADQFNVIKTMILNIEDKLAQQEAQYKRANRKLHGAVAELTEAVHMCPKCSSAVSAFAPGLSNPGTGPNGAVEGPLLPRENGSTSRNTSLAAVQTVPKRPVLSPDGVASTGADPDDEEEPSSNPRQLEMDKYNSSIHLESGKRVFTYYWQIFDMDYKINSWGARRSLRSPSFYVFTYGYMMYLRIYPRQNGQNVYVHVGLTKGEYDEALEWPFTLKHRITVIDQSVSPQDIVSRIWDPQTLCSEWNWKRPASGDNHECVGLGFPHDDLKSRHYIRDDSIIIKLTIYLD